MSVTDTSRLRIALVPPLGARMAPATPGGVEHVVCLLADELVNRGHDVTVFTARDSVTRAKIAAVCETNLLDAMDQGHAGEYNYYETCNLAEVLAHSASFDVVHFHVGAYAIPLGELSRSPVLHTLHNPVTPDEIRMPERYPNAAVTAVGCRQIAGVPAPRRFGIRVVPNACDYSSYEFSAEPGKYLAFLGRMSSAKSPDDAIRIARQAGWPLVMAGQPFTPEERAYFEEKVQPQVDGKNVIYIGAVDHVQKNALLKDAAALVFPVRWEEPFGMVMIEAMACGTPVLALRQGSVEEVVDVGVTGYHADSIEELDRLVPGALALERSLVRQQAQKRFSHKRMADEYLHVYRALMQASRDQVLAAVLGAPLKESICESSCSIRKSRSLLSPVVRLGPSTYSKVSPRSTN